MRKEGKAFASDINGADAMRTPEAEPRLHQISLHHRSLSCACGGMIFLSHVTLEGNQPWNGKPSPRRHYSCAEVQCSPCSYRPFYHQAAKTSAGGMGVVRLARCVTLGDGAWCRLGTTYRKQWRNKNRSEASAQAPLLLLLPEWRWAMFRRPLNLCRPLSLDNEVAEDGAPLASSAESVQSIMMRMSSWRQ